MPDDSREELAIRLREHRGDYGFDAPLQGLVPTGTGGMLLAALAVRHGLRGRRGLAGVEALASAVLLASFSVYVHTTRRGKFAVWADMLAGLDLRGDEHVLDMGCGRGAGLTMVARLVPDGNVVGLDLWTSDQSGNHAEATQRNLMAEGVSDWSELRTGDMLAMPFADGAFDVVVSSMAIHNIDERDIRNHRRGLQALDEAVRALKPGGRLVIADFWSSVYAEHLRQQSMSDVQHRPLGWRF
jgi:SAM-dependent methyltransferase